MYYAYTLGIFVGGIATFLLGAWLGRKWSVGIGAVVAVAGCLVLIAANTAISALLGRLLSGIGGGFTSSSAPVWQVEVAETRMRGRLVVVQLVANGAGYAVALWAIWWYGLSHKADNVPVSALMNRTFLSIDSYHWPYYDPLAWSQTSLDVRNTC